MDQSTLKLITGLSVSYLLGSIPTAYLAGKLTRGIDLRQYGSGNLGATNTFRILGKRAGSVVLMGDILKGTLALLLARSLFYSANHEISETLFLCLSAIAVVSGHNWSLFLNFNGGKGVATSLGVLIGFSIVIERFIWVVATVVFLWLFVFLLTGFVSLASIVGSLLLPFSAIFFHLPKEITYFLLALSIFSLIRHKSNIYRLLHKKESRFNTKPFLKKLLGKTLSK